MNIKFKTTHWIIEDRGFGGRYYKCAECGEIYVDIFTDIDMEDTCPNCGAYIDDDANEYKKYDSKAKELQTRHLAKFICRTDETEIIRKYEESVHKLITVSGYDVDKLIELFAAGHTLQPPDRSCEALMDEMEWRKWAKMNHTVCLTGYLDNYIHGINLTNEQLKYMHMLPLEMFAYQMAGRKDYEAIKGRLAILQRRLGKGALYKDVFYILNHSGLTKWQKFWLKFNYLFL